MNLHTHAVMKRFSCMFALALVVLAVHVNGDEDVDSTTDYTDYKEEENDQPTGLNVTETGNTYFGFYALKITWSKYTRMTFLEF